MTKTQAIVETGLTPMDFRTVCEKLGIDPDLEEYMGVDVMSIKNYAEEKGKKKFKHNDMVEEGYTIEQAASLLGVTKQNFSTQYANKLIRLGRGKYSKQSVDELVTYKNKKDQMTNQEPDITETPIFNTTGKLQRISIEEDGTGSKITFYLKDYTKEELLYRLISVFN